jgi:hypothetical protein
VTAADHDHVPTGHAAFLGVPGSRVNGRKRASPT